MRLFRERGDEEAMAAAEAAGQSLWTVNFSERARIRIWQAFQMTFRPMAETPLFDPWDQICTAVRTKIVVDEGIDQLAGIPKAGDDVYTYLRRGNDEEVGTVVEAMWVTIVDVWGTHQDWLDGAHSFSKALNEALYRERLAYKFVEGRLIERSSEELHTSVVAPTLRLLAGRSEWGAIETAYQKALEEISDGSPDDAITDASTALQEALVVVGCQGNSLGALVKSAKSAGILAPHDSTLNDGIAKIIDWVSGDRSEMGDGHRGASGATRDDAWLIVHIVGALILRLANGPRV